MLKNIKKLKGSIHSIIQGFIVLILALIVINCSGTKPGNGYVSDTPDEIE